MDITKIGTPLSLRAPYLVPDAEQHCTTGCFYRAVSSLSKCSVLCRAHNRSVDRSVQGSAKSQPVCGPPTFCSSCNLYSNHLSKLVNSNSVHT